MLTDPNTKFLRVKKKKQGGLSGEGRHLLPVRCIADLLVLLEFITHHFEELVGISTQVLHQVHEILDGLLHHHRALEEDKRAAPSAFVNSNSKERGTDSQKMNH